MMTLTPCSHPPLEQDWIFQRGWLVHWMDHNCAAAHTWHLQQFICISPCCAIKGQRHQRDQRKHWEQGRYQWIEYITCTYAKWSGSRKRWTTCLMTSHHFPNPNQSSLMTNWMYDKLDVCIPRGWHREHYRCTHRWTEHRNTCPLLSRMAIDYLSIPGLSLPSGL